MPTPKAPRLVRFTVTIRPGQFSGGDIPGFLDMMRYEGGRVVDWTRLDDNVTPAYLITIEVEALRAVPDRWKSFGIYPIEVR